MYHNLFLFQSLELKNLILSWSFTSRSDRNLYRNSLRLCLNSLVRISTRRRPLQGSTNKVSGVVFFLVFLFSGGFLSQIRSGRGRNRCRGPVGSVCKRFGTPHSLNCHVHFASKNMERVFFVFSPFSIRFGYRLVRKFDGYLLGYGVKFAQKMVQAVYEKTGNYK